MKNLSNDLLIQAYKKAIELQLDVDFQLLLKRELLRRKLNINQVHTPIKDSFGFKWNNHKELKKFSPSLL